MHCPICHRPDTRVIDSRLLSDGSKIRRRRECTNPQCATRFTTYETAEISLPMVIKQNGERQAFSAEKLRNGLLRAIEKRPVSVNKINQLIEDIENRLRISGDREVASRKIGEWVMAGLKNIVGGELKGYTELLNEAREEAIARMSEQARQMGANAVVNVRFSTASVAAGAAEIFAYGTAVVIED